VLRPADGFDKGDLAAVFERWVEHAPAMLIIEDLDHALKSMDLAQFLNLVDGIDASATGGLLLIATTNHPDDLDPAINARPGRFDVVMEIAPPDAVLRSRFFRQQLPGLDEETLKMAKRESVGLSFSHLHEVVRLSGLMALSEGRGERTARHVREALEVVREAYGAARRGFPMTAEEPFGLARFRKGRE
jgi:SpoVK/Ycf46/Vps4 family AAA+-type ATPase